MTNSHPPRDYELMDTRLPTQDHKRKTPRETNARATSNRPRRRRTRQHSTGSRMHHKRPARAQSFANITKSKPPRGESQGGVRTEIIESRVLAGPPTRPKRRLSDARTKANRSQSPAKGANRRGKGLHSHCKSSRKLLPERLPVVTTLVSRSICSKSPALANASLLATGLSS
jgi:hypothetical protein